MSYPGDALWRNSGTLARRRARGCWYGQRCDHGYGGRGGSGNEPRYLHILAGRRGADAGMKDLVVAKHRRVRAGPATMGGKALRRCRAGRRPASVPRVRRRHGATPTAATGRLPGQPTKVHPVVHAQPGHPGGSWLPAAYRPSRLHGQGGRDDDAGSRPAECRSARVARVHSISPSRRDGPIGVRRMQHCPVGRHRRRGGPGPGRGEPEGGLALGRDVGVHPGTQATPPRP
jgi:hypothetical protein